MVLIKHIIIIISSYDFDKVPPLTLSTRAGLPNEGQNYSVECDLTGDESLDVTNKTTTWERLTPQYQPDVHDGPTLSFTLLSHDDVGIYNCIVMIWSPYLFNTHVRNKTVDVMVIGKLSTSTCISLTFTYTPSTKAWTYY